MPHVLALYAGRAGTLVTSKGTVRTAIAKRPVSGRVPVGADGLADDEQISPGHGGPDRALCLAAVLALPELAGEWRAKTAPRLARAA